MNPVERLRAVLCQRDKRIHPHGSNLATKLQSDSLAAIQRGVLERLVPEYLAVVKSAESRQLSFDRWIEAHTSAVDEYLQFLRSDQNRVFTHQSDLISSAIPEYVCAILERLIIAQAVGLVVEGQRNIIIEMSFSPMEHGKFHAMYKRVDAAVLLPVELVFRSCDIDGFAIPIVAVEVKTNLDKNMIGGIEKSISCLKSTFPLCKYFVICEFSDFDVAGQNYANTYIDEVYVIRKQRRSEFRRSGRAEGISLEVMAMFVSEIKQALKPIGASFSSMSTRLPQGRLIGGR